MSSNVGVEFGFLEEMKFKLRFVRGAGAACVMRDSLTHPRSVVWSLLLLLFSVSMDEY